MCKCVGNVQMRWKCANALEMCKCENVQMICSLCGLRNGKMQVGKYSHILTLTSHLHILTFAHLHICTFAHLHICTFTITGS